MLVTTLAFAASPARAERTSADPKAAAAAQQAARPAPAIPPGGVDYSPEGVALMPMRVKANQDRARAAVKAFERRRAANALPKSMLPPDARSAPRAAPARGNSGGGTALGGAARAVLALALAQVGPPPDLFAVPNYANSPLPVASCSVSGLPCVADSDCKPVDGVPGTGYVPPTAVGYWLVPEGETCTGPVQSGGIRKFVDQLPGLCGIARPETDADGKNALGQCLPLATPDTTTFPDADYYEIAVKDYPMRFHSDLPVTNKVRGYYQKNASGDPHDPHYLGPVILATRDRPVRVKLVNEVGTGDAGKLFVPVDPTLHGAGLGPDGVSSYAENRATFHLHGGNTPWISDGTQHQWTVPAGEQTPYKKGLTTANVPDMWFDASGNLVEACKGQTTCAVPGATNDPGDGAMTFYWTNQQSGRLMFYHDHAYGITRLNVYAGEAAGYLLVDPKDEAVFAGATVPGTITGDPSTTDLQHVLPLVIQDKTFVPPPTQLAAQDPTWDTAKWGGYGSLWYPHVYTPNQWPGNPDGSSANPMGRWDYGPWFWPPLTSLTASPTLTQPCTSQAAVTDTNPTGATECPVTPTPSAVPESFLDTPLVNGTAYPTVTVDPTAYRFYILNAAQERNFSLSFFVADASGTEVPMVDAVPHGTTATPPICASNAPKSPVTGLPSNCWPRTWPTDGRVGGVPDPLAAGPAIVQLGSEGGILPAPAVIPAQPVNYEYNRRNVVVLNVSDKALFIGPAERADVVVDFSAYAGKTLILYNDAPAPVPAFDTRLDYFTGAYDQTLSGGAPTPHAGYGPNTRTIMQVKVRAQPVAAVASFDPGKAATALAARFKVSQPAPVVPQAAFNPVYGTSFTNNYLGIQARNITFTPTCALTTPPTCSDPPVAKQVEFAWKAIQELFETDYGRMNATLGVETPLTSFLNQTTVPYFNFDPTTEFIADDKPQVWKITHNGVDTHTIHFHLLNAQIINRVGWDGQIRPPDANEQGWKESVRMHPLEDIYVALRPVRQALPWPLPDMHRPLDVTKPLGSTTQFTGVDINNLPITVENTVQNFGWEYVWHCHLLGHEENDMLRAEVFVVAPETPTALTVQSASPGQVTLVWNDESKSAQTFTIQRDTSPFFTSPALGTFSTPAPAVQPGPVTYDDATIAPDTTYWYRVRGEKVLSSPAIPGSTWPAASAWSNVFQSGTAPKGSLSTTALTFAPEAIGTTSASQRVTLTNGGTADLLVSPLAFAGANGGDFGVAATTCNVAVAPGAACTIDVTFTAGGLGARAATLAIASNDPWTPTASVAVSGAGPSATVAPAGLAFGTQVVGTTTAAQSVTLSNAGPNALAIGSITLGGTDGSDFAIATSSTCASSLAAGGTCTVDVTFAPTAFGARSASLAIATSDPVYPTLSVSLGGTGATPIATLSATSLAFGNRQVGTTTAAQTFTLSNTGAGPLAFTGITVAGTNPGDFAATSNCAPTIAVGASCTVSVTFTPSVPGARSASVVVTTNDPAHPVQSVAVTGTGISVTLTASLPSPQPTGTAVTFTATAYGSSGYQYRFWRISGGATTLVRDWATTAAWTLPSTTAAGTYSVQVDVRTSATVFGDPAAGRDAYTRMSYVIATGFATGVTLTSNLPSPQFVGTPVVFTAQGQGSSGYQYRFWLISGGVTALVQNWATTATWTLPGTTVAGTYTIQVDVRTNATAFADPAAGRDAYTKVSFVIANPFATGVTLTPSLASPQRTGTPVLFTAQGQGSSGYQYRFWLVSGGVTTLVQNWSATATWTLPGTTGPGTYTIQVDVRTNSTVFAVPAAGRDAYARLSYGISP